MRAAVELPSNDVGTERLPDSPLDPPPSKVDVRTTTGRKDILLEPIVLTSIVSPWLVAGAMTTMKVPLGPVTMLVMPAIACAVVKPEVEEGVGFSKELPAIVSVVPNADRAEFVTRPVSFFNPDGDDTEAVEDVIGVSTVIGGLPEGETTTGCKVRVDVDPICEGVLVPLNATVGVLALNVEAVTFPPSETPVGRLLPEDNDDSSLKEKPYPGGMPAEGPFGKGSFVTYTEGVETFPPP